MTQIFKEISSRPMFGDDDFWQVHRLLMETLPIMPVGFNWDMRRWEGKRYYDQHPAGNPDWERNGRLWHTASGPLVSTAHQEGGPGFAYLEVHPDYRHLEGEMIEWAEHHLAAATKAGSGQQVHFFVYEYDVHRQALLTARGYEKMTYGGVIWTWWQSRRTGHLRLTSAFLTTM